MVPPLRNAVEEVTIYYIQSAFGASLQTSEYPISIPGERGAVGRHRYYQISYTDHLDHRQPYHERDNVDNVGNDVDGADDR